MHKNLNHMKKHIILILSFMLSVSTAYCQSIDRILNRLDKAITNRPAYIQKKQEALEHLRLEASRKKGSAQFDAYCNLFQEYRSFSADSALHYASLCEQWARQNKDLKRLQIAQIKRLTALSIIGQHDEANLLIDSLRGKVIPENKQEFFSAQSDIRYWQGSMSFIPDTKEKLLHESYVLRDSLSHVTQDRTLLNESQAMLISSSDPMKAASMARRYLATLPEGHDSIRHFAHHLGNFYLRSGQRDSSEYFFALSSISDMECGIREYSSLILLTTQLFEDGDVDRAYRYMTQCMKDAEDCKSLLRTTEISKMTPLIMEAYNKKLKRNEYGLLIISIILFIVLIIAFTELVRIIRDHKTLKEIQQKIKQDNLLLKTLNEQLGTSLQKEKDIARELQESNCIKDTYLGIYMSQCSAVIDKLETYRKQLQTLAMRNNTSKLFEAIRSTEFIEKEVEEFYKGFDETFLSVFPTFVEEFNQMLTPTGQLTPPGPKRLNTELRIAALIRLGINNSEDIAAFLRYSVKTIYNYRTKIRNNALGDRSELEAKLKQIGIKES